MTDHLNSEEPEAGEPLLPGRDDLAPGTELMSNEEVAGWLGERIRDREPAAMVRFGDSEARLLAAGDWYPVERAMDLLRRETGSAFSIADVHALQALVATAYDEADVLGIRYRARFAGEAKQQVLSMLANCHAERVAKGKQPAILARCLVSYALVDSLPEILAGRRVSVISCRDLKPILEGEWGADDVATYQVPSQLGFRDVDGPYEAAMHGERIWPDVHSRLRSRLRVREPGEVFLVGAGVFGKDLCIEVRRQGGIAVDMGSALDHIAGKLTRGPERRLLELHNRGMTVAEITAEARRIYRVEVDEGTVAERLQAVLADLGRDMHQSAEG